VPTCKKGAKREKERKDLLRHKSQLSRGRCLSLCGYLKNRGDAAEELKTPPLSWSSDDGRVGPEEEGWKSGASIET